MKLADIKTPTPSTALLLCAMIRAGGTVIVDDDDFRNEDNLNIEELCDGRIKLSLVNNDA